MPAYKVRLDDGSEMGPLDPEMMRSWYQQGLINPESKVRLAGGKSWSRLIDVVDISSWGAAGGTKGREAEAEDEYEELSNDPQRWRIFMATDSMRKVVRVLVFLLTFSLFAVAAPVLLQGFQWRPLAILVSAWVMGSGLFFFLAGRPLRWSSIAMCLFWILAGAAGVGALGYVPTNGAPAFATTAGESKPDDRLAAPWSPSATAVTRELPLLSPRAAELVVSYGLDRPEAAFKKSYLLAANGMGRLSPQEAKELGQLTTAVYAPLPPPNRKRLDGYMERVRGLQVTQPQEDREMTALVREAVLQLPESQRTRYQLLYEKALGASR